MATYTCSGYKAVEADSAEAAAGVFALRHARREHGTRGRVQTLRRDSWTEDGSSTTFEAFIGGFTGTPSEPGNVIGHNIWITVQRA